MSDAAAETVPGPLPVGVGLTADVLALLGFVPAVAGPPPHPVAELLAGRAPGGAGRPSGKPPAGALDLVTPAVRVRAVPVDPPGSAAATRWVVGGVVVDSPRALGEALVLAGERRGRAELATEVAGLLPASVIAETARRMWERAGA